MALTQAMIRETMSPAERAVCTPVDPRRHNFADDAQTVIATGTIAGWCRIAWVAAVSCDAGSLPPH